MDARHGVSRGLPVYSSDGSMVGKVTRLGETIFEVAKGYFLPRDFFIPYADVVRVDRDGIRLLRDRDWLRSFAEHVPRERMSADDEENQSVPRPPSNRPATHAGSARTWDLMSDDDNPRLK